ncbi:DUF4197 domain-containing protein [Arcobacter peruensis]|uniref:DUF4197 domain-containing protein n=1 Tax=Arcobacter peruensis TaxID=2320140 RepID=UPI000F095EE5|nr:DUF4197 domain-containing protein [Arcobacter peruensis]
MKKSTIIASLILTSSLSYAFDLGSIAKDVIDNVTNETKTADSKSSTNTVNSNLDNSTVTSGLKQALKTGVTYAVENLSKDNGYLNNSLVKIPLPENLAKVETLLRSAGGDKMADNLINSMNKAATTAAPKTASIFANAIEKMSVDDAKNILAGSNNAATEYFKTNTTDSLKEMIAPIIQETMKENQVASYYDMANNFYKENAKGMVESTGVMDMAKSFGVDSYLPGSSDQSIDDYVTDKAINGLFTMIAQKEAQIRTNPVAQTTSLLKQVFGN